ncbi:MAG: signal recognition particle-docking protein FtsY [Anaerolineaceae bacterium]|nr:signal recognition particle-docking protein FtsY [Anaerolineaceae bacterium]
MADKLSKWLDGLTKTRKAAFGRIANIFGATEITEDTWDELEGLLVQADLGIETTTNIIKALQNKVFNDGIIRTEELESILKSEMLLRIDASSMPKFEGQKPAIILLVGVNGSGKTTTAAKLAKLLNINGKKVLLAAADTFRAAAVDQLQVWGERLNIPVIAGAPGSDPGAVAYDAVQSAISKNFDIVLVDTAGRLHTRFNLMEELKKVHRVVGKALPGAPHAVWLVIDSTTGQNALLQAKAFKEAVNVTGIILAKLDTSAKGGMVFAIQDQLGLPILFAGLGEKPEDLTPFDPESFVDGILSKK